MRREPIVGPLNAQSLPYVGAAGARRARVAEGCAWHGAADRHHADDRRPFGPTRRTRQPPDCPRGSRPAADRNLGRLPSVRDRRAAAHPADDDVYAGPAKCQMATHASDDHPTSLNLQGASCRSRIATLSVATVSALKFILTEFPVKLMFAGLKLLDGSSVTPRIVGAFANTKTNPLNVPLP